MARSKNSQTKHNRQVRKIANSLEGSGFNVQADISGFAQPKTIGGYRPDIIAKKGIQRKIVEVETPESVDSARDKKQQSAFRNAASRSSETIFRRVITK